MELNNTKYRPFYLKFIDVLNVYFFKHDIKDGDEVSIRNLRDMMLSYCSKDKSMKDFEEAMMVAEKASALVNEAVRIVNRNCYELGFRFEKKDGKKYGRVLIYRPVTVTPPPVEEVVAKATLTIDEKLEVIARLIGEIRRDREDEKTRIP